MRILIRDENSKHWTYADSVETKSESELQKLVVDSPSLIPISDIRDDLSPLILGIPEFGLPGSGNSDVIAFTADGDIAIIECKLAANPEIKRKVIGQIIEYASFLWGMSYEVVDERVQLRLGKSLTTLVSEEVAGDWNEKAFRDTVFKSLQTGDFILVIVIDQINNELRQIIRYINERGTAGFTLHALELERFKSQGKDVLVPHLHGISTKETKLNEGRKKWTESEFFEALAKGLDKIFLERATDLYKWSESIADRIWFGTGTAKGSFTLHFLLNKKTISIFSMFTDGKLSLNYGWLFPQINEPLMKEFHSRIVSIPTFSKIPDDFAKWPMISFPKAFPSDKELSDFKKTVEWFHKVIKEK